AVGDAHGHDVDAAALAHHGDAARSVAQRAETRDMVRMQVRVDRLHQLQIELPNELQVAIDPADDRVDDQRLARAAAGDRLAGGAGDSIEQLAKNHAPPSRRAPLTSAAAARCGYRGAAPSNPADRSSPPRRSRPSRR